MPLEARLKQDYFMNSITAFSGREYLKSEWRPIPERFEEEAKAHEFLDVREIGDTTEPETVKADIEPMTDETAVEKKPTEHRRTKKETK